MASRLTSQEAALRADAEKRRIERTGVNAATAIARRVRLAAIRTAAVDPDGAAAIAGALIEEAMEPLIREMMVLAHLRGRRRTLIAAGVNREANGMELAVAGAPFTQAVAFIRRRSKLTAEQIGQLEREYGDEAVRVTRGLRAVVEQKVSGAVVESVRVGANVRQTQTLIRRAFASAGVTGEKLAGLPGGPHLAETLARTQTLLAYSAGQQAAAKDPAVDAILWGWEYTTVGDDRVRLQHAMLDGMRLPKDDPRWKSMTPPNGWNCRCSVITIFKDDPAATEKDPLGPTEVDGKEVVPGPDPGWAFNPADVATDSLIGVPIRA